MGLNNEHQLGICHKENVQIPRRIPMKVKIYQIAVGSEHSLMLSEHSNLWTFGSNKHGQCAQRNDEWIKSPTMVNPAYFGNDKICQISAGYWHNVVICADEDVWAFGCNDEGQCGISKKHKSTRTPHQLSIKGTHVECGWYHTLVMTKERLLLTFGWNEDGQLGIGSNERSQSQP